ncbi:YoaK family protein [Paraburkholderia fungorum]|uniref:YoaK family protein n=1 Tax=Paraburkholderia fungorum TaxID=134537 RepID=UPI0038BAF59D
MKSEDTVLAAVAGYVDTLGFVALFGLFTAHVTGNFVLIGASVAGFGQGVFLKLMAFPAFIAGVAVSSVLVRRQQVAAPLHAASLLYSVQTVLLLAFCISGIKIGRALDANRWPVVLCGMLGAAAMGVQNAHGRLVPRAGLPNTVMTGNVTQLILDAVDLLSAHTQTDTKAAARARLVKMVPAVVAFAAGAAGGALGYRVAAFWALLLPFLVLAGLAIAAWLEHRVALASANVHR